MGLVFEGGGMRGIYFQVLDAFMDEGIKFPYVIGVSAGANNGTVTYLNKEAEIKSFVDSKRQKVFRHLNLLKSSYFNMDFIFDEIPNKIVPLIMKLFKIHQ